MRDTLALAIAAAVLGACGGPETNNQAAQPVQPQGYTPTQQKVVDMPDGLRAGVLLRAIRDGGAPCQSVVEGARQPDRAGAPLYVARCEDGPQYAVAIGRTGMGEVTRLNPGDSE